MAQYSANDYDYVNDADFWFEEWVNSPSHYENILRENYTHVGVGVYYQERDGIIYAVACTIFGQF